MLYCSACHTYVCNMGGVKSQPFFLYMSAVSNAVTTRNGHIDSFKITHHTLTKTSPSNRIKIYKA